VLLSSHLCHLSSGRRSHIQPSIDRLVLEAKRFSGNDALECWVVDGLGGIEETMGLVEERKLVEKGKSGVYGTMKAEMFRDYCLSGGT
jgi:hypothetical protein